MADSTSGNLTLPTFEPGKTYLLKGETLQQICDVIKENKLVLTGTKQFDEIGPDGSKLKLDAENQLPGTGCADGFQCVPDPPETGTWVLGVIDGDIQWIETDDCTEVDAGEA